jgi:hypothetical protein
MESLTTLTSWQIEFQKEIETANSARRRGNEGMARVCARRAAGIIASEYLLRQGIQIHSMSAYQKIKLLQEQPDLTAETHQIASHFLLRITPEHTLPDEIDLISEALLLKQALLRNLVE